MSALWEEFLKWVPQKDLQSATNYMLGALMADRSHEDIQACIENVKALLGRRGE